VPLADSKNSIASRYNSRKTRASISKNCMPANSAARDSFSQMQETRY
jgi:hypothetical protein